MYPPRNHRSLDGVDQFYVVFSARSQFASWVDLFTDRRFRHVSVIRIDARTGVWVWMDAGADKIILDPWRMGDADDDLARELFPNDAILRVFAGIGPVFGSRWLPSCVTAVKHAISSPSRALRPSGLWRDLVQSGAVIVKEPHATENPRQSATGRPGIDAAQGT